MSELIAYNSERIYWAVEQVEQETRDIDDLHLDDNLFYIKSEADKVIAYLKNEIEEQKRLRDMALASVPNVLKVMKIIQHHKYKRCLAMVEKCHALYDKYSMLAADDANWEEEDYYFARWRFFEKWKYKWLELAKKFKEAKQ